MLEQTSTWLKSNSERKEYGLSGMVYHMYCVCQILISSFTFFCLATVEVIQFSLFAFWIRYTSKSLNRTVLKTRKENVQFNQFKFSQNINLGACCLLHFHLFIRVIGNDFFSTRPQSYKRLLRSCTWFLNSTTIVRLIIASLIIFPKLFSSTRCLCSVLTKLLKGA